MLSASVPLDQVSERKHKSRISRHHFRLRKKAAFEISFVSNNESIKMRLQHTAYLAVRIFISGCKRPISVNIYPYYVGVIFNIPSDAVFCSYFFISMSSQTNTCSFLFISTLSEVNISIRSLKAITTVKTEMMDVTRTTVIQFIFSSASSFI